jgi:hypothetical protein
MKQEDKDLLLKDLCGRLPYGVKAYIKNWSKLDRKYYEGVYTVGSVYPSINNIYGYTENGSVEVILGYSDYFIKPYLFPLSSMTSKQKAELSMLVVGVEDIFKAFLIEVEFYHKHHIDYRGLIPMGLAINCTNLNIY